jgi:hypothetical protein
MWKIGVFMSTRSGAVEPAAVTRLASFKKGIASGGLDPAQQTFYISYAYENDGTLNSYDTIAGDLINTKKCDILFATCWFTLRALWGVTEQFPPGAAPPKILYAGMVDAPDNPRHQHPKEPARHPNVHGSVSREYDVHAFVQVLRDIVALNARTLSRVAVIYWVGDPCGQVHFDKITQALRPIPTVAIDVNDPSLQNLIEDFKHAHSNDGGIIVPPSQNAAKRRDVLIGAINNAATNPPVPAVYPNRMYVESGGLASYGAVLLDQYELAGKIVATTLQDPNSFPHGPRLNRNFETVGNTATAANQHIRLPADIIHYP